MSDMTLYAITDTLPALLDMLDMVAAGSPEETEIKAEITKYMQALPTKVDSVAHVMKNLEYIAKAQREEAAELEKLARANEGKLERLKEYVKFILEMQPTKRLEGRTRKLALQANGGSVALEISCPADIPEEFCQYRGSVDAVVYQAMKLIFRNHPQIEAFERVPNNAQIRAAIEKEGGIPGARLGERGEHVRIR